MSTELLIALIALVGTFISQITLWFVTKSTIQAATERLHSQISREYELKQFSNWQSELRESISELLTVTDPEGQESISKHLVAKFAHKTQLLLNQNIANHASVNRLVNQLALQVNDWLPVDNHSEILRTHSELLEASKEILYLPSAFR